MVDTDQLEAIQKRYQEYADLMAIIGWAPDQLSNVGHLCLIDVPWLLEEIKKPA